MNSTKPWYQSKTIWGSLIAVTASIAEPFGLKIDPPTQVELTESIFQAIQVAGSLFAIYGRLDAVHGIA